MSGGISGRVLDTRGRPVVEAHVVLVRRDAASGGNATTDDRGEYVFPNLLPGDYTVGVPITLTSRTVNATPPPRSPNAYIPGFQPYVVDRTGRAVLTVYGAPVPAPSSAGAGVYVTSYHGGGSALASARYFPVTLGQTRSGIDVVIDDRPVRRVSGTALTAAGPVPGVVITLTRPGAAQAYRDGNIVAHASADGSFVFVGVPEGAYELTAFQRNPPFTPVTFVDGTPSIAQDDYLMGDRDVLSAAMPLALGAEDIADVVVALKPGTGVSGRVVAEDGTPIQLRGGSRVVFTRPQRDYPGGGDVNVQAAPDGTFAGRAKPGRYSLDAAGQVPNWSFKTARLDGRDLDDATIEIGDRPVNGLELVYVRGGTSLAGAIVDARGNPFADATVLVFATSDRKWDGAETAGHARLDRTGSAAYSIQGLTPGEYYAIAVDEASRRIGTSREFLERLAPRAARVQLRPGDPVTLTLIVQDAAR